MDNKDYGRIGILSYLTSTPGLGGVLKRETEDFIVQEIFKGKVASLEPKKDLSNEQKEYVHFTLVKRDWETSRILKKIARNVGTSYKRLSYAGTKDKRAVTAQRVSVWHISPERLANVNIRDCELGDFAASDEKIELGHHDENKFTVRVRDVKKDEIVLKETLEQMKNSGGMPNFFGEQRFGMRLNNHVVGRCLINEDIEGAVRHFLVDVGEGELEDGKKARTFLKENWGEFREALNLYPRFARPERVLIEHLHRYPNDFVGAIKRLPKNLYKIFTHSYQAYLFNLVLSERMKEGNMEGSAHLLGYESEPSEFEKELLEREGLSVEDLRVKSFPEASVRGDDRELITEIKNIDYSFKDDFLEIKFDLKKGAYATVFLREIMKKDK